ncbi:putative xylose transporter [Scheffersomyces xylosifermentans]|uniref:putative xylose transporter n=1 Tax=Scheffersomyces xylosifermentans TaxID=1304137 RepID=UPI00315D0B23
MKSVMPTFIPDNRFLFFVSVLVMTIVHPMILGFDSMMVGSILNLPSYRTFFNLTNVIMGLNTASIWIGAILACITTTQIVSDRFGRKNAIFLSIFIIIAGVVLQSAAQNVGMFVVGRILLGFGTSVGNVASVILVSELVPVRRRGFLMGLSFSCFLVGSLFASGITYATRNLAGNWSWRVPSIIQGAPEIIVFLNLVFIPESPRWLIRHERLDEATELVALIENITLQDAHIECNELVIKLEYEAALVAGSNPWSELLTKRKNARRVWIFMTQAFLTEMAGSSVGSYYLSILLEQAGFKNYSDRLRVNIAMSSWALAIAIFGCLCFDKLGRKKQAVISLTGMVVSFIILGNLIRRYGDGHSRGGTYSTVAFMFIFTGFYAFTYTPLTSLYPAELCPFILRSTGVVAFNLMNSSWGLIAGFILPIAMNSIGWKFYIINACYDAIFIPIIIFLWVETKGITLDDVDELFSESLLKGQDSDVRSDRSIKGIFTETT